MSDQPGPEQPPEDDGGSSSEGEPEDGSSEGEPAHGAAVARPRGQRISRAVDGRIEAK